MPRLRIAVVSPFIDKKHGSERQVAECLSRLAADCEFHLYSTRVDDIELAGITWHRVPAAPGPHLLAYLWWFAANHVQRWWDRRFRGIRPDLIYSPGINCLDADVITVHAIFARMLDRLGGELRLRGNPLAARPRIIHRRLYYRLIASLERRVYRRPGVLLAGVSGKLAADLDRYFERRDVIVVYNGIGVDQFSPESRAALRPAARETLGLRPDDFALLLIGNDWKSKGLPCVIEAVQFAANPRLRILVVGRDNPAPFSPAIRKAGLASRLQFLPIRPDVEFYYAAADAYVSPSLEDAFALPPAEAMACGLPVITSRNNGGSEIIHSGMDGFVLEDPRNSGALAQLIQCLAADPERCRQMGAAAARTVRQCNWERHSQQMRELFERAWVSKNAR